MLRFILFRTELFSLILPISILHQLTSVSFHMHCDTFISLEAIIIILARTAQTHWVGTILLA